MSLVCNALITDIALVYDRELDKLILRLGVAVQGEQRTLRVPDVEESTKDFLRVLQFGDLASARGKAIRVKCSDEEGAVIEAIGHFLTDDWWTIP
jgi:hypothetical protein